MQGQNGQGRKLFRDKTKNISYVKGKLLGTGGFAKCYEAISSADNRLYAAKVIPKKSINEKRQRYKLLIEIKIHKSLKHRHIVEFMDAFEDKENIYILLEYCRNYTLKDLAKRRKRLTEFETRVYVGQLVRAMVYIHSQGIIHRDLKLGNVLINEQMDVKICDFGLSTRIKGEGDVKKTICGTPNYIAPEILEEQGHSYEVDIWSIGVIMYALLFGKPPFEDNTVEQTYENIKNNRYIFPANIQISLAAKDLINRILVMDPTRRLSLEEILEHEFMVFPEGTPHSLPLSSLAVPPTDYDKLPTRINLNDMHLELSEQMDGDASALLEQRANEGSRKKLPDFVFVRECFKYEESVGYLLSNGIVGSLNKKTNICLTFQFGQEYYYTASKGQKPMRRQLPESYEENDDLARLFHFKAFFIAKYSLFKLEEMRKRTGESEVVLVLRRAVLVGEREIATRLSNNIIQLHFGDLTSLTINREDEKGIYLVNRRGLLSEVNYNQCKSSRLKAKVRRFSNLIQKLSPKDDSQEGQSYEQSEDDEEELSHNDSSH